MKYFFLLIIALVIFACSKTFITNIYSFENTGYEKSEPYISFSTDKNVVLENEQFIFLVKYGNKGIESAENVKIIFNQPLDGRAPLKFVSSEPKPDKWIISEYGNLAEFIIDRLETYEATEEGKIEIKVQVRETVASQILTPTANLQAPNREIGKRLVVSDSLKIEIKSELAEVNDKQEEIAGTTVSSEVKELKNAESIFKDNSSTPDEKPANLSQKLLTAESIWTTGAFLAISALLIIAFIAGRKSTKS